MSRNPYRRSVPRYSWWLSQQRYVVYMIREATSLFILAYSLLLIMGLWGLAQGRKAYDAYLQALTGPAGTAFHLVAFLFALYHTATWFHVTPKAMPIQIGTYRVPGEVVIGAHYLGWFAVSLIVALLVGI